MQADELISAQAYQELREQHGEHVMVTSAVLIVQCIDADGEPTLTHLADDDAGVWVHIGALAVIRHDLLAQCTGYDD